MKISTILLFVNFLTISAATYSQNEKFTLKKENCSLKDLLFTIESQSHIKFLYRDEIVENRFVSINLQNVNLEEALIKVLQNSGNTYRLLENNLVVIAPLETFQQQKVVGTVTDVTSKEPLPGVNVMVEGTSIGVITDMDGKYVIEVNTPNANLVFSFMGYNTEKVNVNNRNTVDISMVPDIKKLEEVVVVGYGTQKKVNLTGAVASVGGDDLAKRPVANAGSLMEGLLPGVQIVQNSGEPGNEGINIKIRGIGTFSGAGSDPLVLVDGVQGNLSNLNPNDIENVSVLKDAASASIYGSRAANGVILVTTKTGKVGKISIEYSGNYAIHTPTKMFKLVTNSAEYMELYNEARTNSGLTADYTQSMIDAYRNATDRKLYPNCDWLDLLFNPAPTQTHDLSFSGGNEKTRYNVSLGYVNQEGVMKGFSYEKYNMRINLSSQVNSKIKFGGNVSVKKGVRSGPRQGAEDTFLAAMAQAPTYTPQLADGSGRYSYKAYDFEYNNKNPFAIIDNKVFRNTDDYAIYSQGWLDVELFKGLKWYTKAAINLDFSKYDDYRPNVPLYNFRTNNYSTNLDVGGNGLIVQDDQNVYQNIYSYLTYETKIADAHSINLQLGYSTENNVYQYLNGYRKYFTSDNLRQLNAGSQSVQTASGTKNEWALMSFFGRLGYNYKERYLLEGNLRYDGSSRLTPSSRWGAFPSFSAGWRVTEEQFIKDLNLNWLNNLKLRASYGKLGNQNIGLYPYQALLNLTSSYSFDDAALSTGVAQTALANTNIKWETTTMQDIGFDLKVFQGLDINFDWYKKTTTDILRSSQLTSVVGLSAPTVNNGTMENKGFEIGINYSNFVKSGVMEGLKYNMGFNFDHYKNRLVSYGAREIGGNSIREEGQEWDSYYMIEQTGIFQSQDEVNGSPKQYTDATLPGDLKFKDTNGDGVVNDKDKVYIKGRYPSYNYSFHFNSEWKGLDLSMQLQGVEGVKYYVDGWGTIPFVQGAPPTTDWRDRWTDNNHSATMPRIYWGWGAPQKISRTSSWFLQDGSYMRVKNITLGYTLPGTLTKRIGIDRLRVYFSGDNLITITKYRGLDPERGGSGSLVHYPQNKIYSFGVNVTF